MVRFHESLSEQSVYMRYFHALNLDQRTAHERLTRICFIDYDREMALVATRRDSSTGEQEIIGVGRLSKFYQGEEAEFALLISDKHQRMGLGTELLRRLLEVGRQEGVKTVMAYMLPENRGMKRIAEGLGFSFTREEDLVRAKIELDGHVA